MLASLLNQRPRASWCRIALGIALTLLSAGAAHAQLPFGAEHRRVEIDPPRRHHQRVRQVDMEHIRLRIDPDLETGDLSGMADLQMVTILPVLDEISLDAGAGLQISSVMLNDVETPFTHDAGQLRVGLGQARPSGTRLRVRVHYTARPEAGYLFVRRTRPDGSTVVMIHTQGESEYHHEWFPCYDSPNDLLTSEVLVRVPDGYRVLSNGVLRGADSNGLPPVESLPDGRDMRTFQWSQSLPHATYLITLVIGRFDRLAASHNGLPLAYYAPEGAGADLAYTFGRTPQMIQLFTELVGVPYPWDRYDQVIALGFEMGGMENTGQTTLHEGTPVEPRDAPDVSSDTLIAHELAHQWWGDLVTCADWSHIWLNEGFATYYEALWLEHAEGADAAAWDLYGGSRWYFGQDAGGRRAIVWDGYASPDAVFDAYAYPKGAWVLHMLRHVLGDEDFFASLRSVLIAHRHHNIVTDDLRAHCEQVSGQDLGWFFDQWLHHGGHPEYRVRAEHHADAGVLLLEVEQAQKVDDLTPLFRMPVDVDVVDSGGAVTRHRIEVARARQTFVLPAASAPLDVRFDAGSHILCQIEFEKPEAWLIQQLTTDPDVMGRRRAAESLADRAAESPTAREALGSALASDAGPEMRAHLAELVGAIAGGCRWRGWQDSWDVQAPDPAPAAGVIEWSRDALLEALGSDQDSRVRTAAIRALANFPGDERAIAAAERASVDPGSDHRRAAGVRALGRIGGERHRDSIAAALGVESHRDTVARQALRALEDLEDPGLFQCAAAKLQPDSRREMRQVALSVLEALGNRNDPQIVRILVPHLDDDDRPIRSQVISLLGRFGHLDPELAEAALSPVMLDTTRPQRAGAAKQALAEIEKKLAGGGK